MASRVTTAAKPGHPEVIPGSPTGRSLRALPALAHSDIRFALALHASLAPLRRWD
jgi:hypothetical protein